MDERVGEVDGGEPLANGVMLTVGGLGGSERWMKRRTEKV